MGKLIGQLVVYIIIAPLMLFILHLFTVGGFGTSFGMVVDDARMLVACPSKPGEVWSFLNRSDAEKHTIWLKDSEFYESPFRTYNIDDEGALDAICDRVPIAKE